MNMQELQNEWRQYGQQLTATKDLSERMIMSMLKERSRSRVTKIKRENNVLLIYLVLVLAALSAVFAGNPFDFKNGWQYIPYAMLGTGVLLAMLKIFRNQQDLTTDINKTGLAFSLKKIIEGYEKTRKMESWFGILMFAAGIATVFSFLPNKLAHKPVWAAVGETGIMILITLLIYAIAFKAGAFKNRKVDFENDLQELNELKKISAELSNN